MKYEREKKLYNFPLCQEKAVETGKLLAYALMSDFLFTKQTVSLMGFSLGTVVILR